MKKLHKVLISVLIFMVTAGVIFAAGETETETEGPIEVTIMIRAKGNPVEHWKVDAFDEAVIELNAELKSEGDNRTIVIEKIFDDADWSDVVRSYTMAADAGMAPDIIHGGHEHIAVYATAGYIIPLADSVSAIRRMYPEFNDIIVNLWDSAQLRGKVWGIPQDVEARPFYFNIPKLREL